MNLSNQPPKGTADWLPSEFAIRKYIFDTWREVCTRFGYEEYLTPIIESAEIYRAKSGEDVGGKELMTMFDRAEREYAIRPEMTPSVTRMVSRIYNDTPKPIRLFSIANYFRNEKPQRGRNREFWQLNFDIFGTDSINADVEIIQMAIEIMKAFGASSSQFEILVNSKNTLLNRDEIKNQTPEVQTEAVRLIDKIEKLDRAEWIKQFIDRVGSTESDANKLYEDLTSEYPEANQDEDIMQLLNKLEELGLKDYVRFSPKLARGFDYYDGIVFEVFDKNPENSRAMFGGGRYNGLGSLFGGASMPAVGCAPGDETTKLFLESWGLIPDLKSQISNQKYYIPLLEENFNTDIQSIATKLREEGKNVEVGLDVQKMGKALEYANKKEIGNVVIFGEMEKEKGEYIIKNMQSGEQDNLKF
ncbi:histidine--tRNA ligase [Candidatus Dojkabacteria bacterium]|uniref:Histidine--tRNA ligase n=1 Tax=Candidatus Dojkabacteria bacterium TaxID=2099670 RepID=A0A955I8A5_9BACT|nr:histidine--tRNA ligase [Candidatus Dojkabacteria bacterium]